MKCDTSPFVEAAIRIASVPVSSVVLPVMTWLKWCPSSRAQLVNAEQKVLTLTSNPHEVLDVEIGKMGDVENCKIHTVKVECSAEEKGTPLVMLHGFGCGAAIFAPNLDELSQKRDVYAIDMLGFGLSSRASLSCDAKMAEMQVVESIEKWRKEVKLEKFILLGHSLGGFVSSAYALSHSEHIKHLILEDPWGFPEYDPSHKSTLKIPLWGKAIMTSLNYLNAMSAVRAAGPAGPGLMKSIVGERHNYFGGYFPDDPDTIPEYLYHCNVRKPTGEEFFRTISVRFGWTKYPMVTRLGKIDKDVGMTFIHATRTFINQSPSVAIQSERADSNVDIHVVNDCGHTIHMERPAEFNKLVSETCDKADRK